MAGGKGTTYKNSYLTWALTTAVAPTRPNAWNVALYTDASAATEATTSNCPGYARQSISFGSTAASGGTISNTTAATFTATGAWVTINSFAILDQSGNIIEWGPLSTPRTLAVSGDKIQFDIGQITITES